ncbi:MAG: NAD(P)-dependent oxidoreductase, partial [Actinomycetota bacterium]
MLNVDVADRLVIVVGCGPAGQEKVDRLLAAGARIRVVDPNPPADLDSRVEIVEHAVEVDEATSDWLDDAWLVVAATGRPAVDEWVQATAEARATWVVRADRSDGGGVSFAATIEQPPVVVGVTTGGSSPTLARWLR